MLDNIDMYVTSAWKYTCLTSSFRIHERLGSKYRIAKQNRDCDRDWDRNGKVKSCVSLGMMHSDVCTCAVLLVLPAWRLRMRVLWM